MVSEQALCSKSETEQMKFQREVKDVFAMHLRLKTEKANGTRERNPIPHSG